VWIWVAALIESALFVYGIAIILRVAMSWFPESSSQGWVRVLARVTDPLLSFLRRIVPPIGGRLDVSPILAILLLQLLQYFFGSLLSGSH
jgi:YggT family protein